jgi:hypothetical protein
MEKIQFKSRRFVFHVSPKRNRESILEFGLLPRGKRGYFKHYPKENPDAKLFVHNFPFPVLNLDFSELVYPFAVYGYYDDLPEDYDYWLIDTKGLDNIWHIDFLMLYDLNGFFKGNSYGYHLWSPTPIPVEAITLCEFDEGLRDYCDVLLIKRGVEGVCHTSYKPLIRPNPIK